jgi:hypothetical protein
MENITLNSIKARYPELLPIGGSKDDFKKALDYFKEIEDKRFIISCNEMNYKPYMVAYLLKYLSNHDRFPEIILLNVHEVSELYITGLGDRDLLRLSDVNPDILFLTAGYSEPNNKSLKDCVGFILNNLTLKDKSIFLYLKGTSMLVKDIESLAKSLEFPKYNLNLNSPSKKVSKPSKSSSNSSQMSLF